MNTVFFAMLYYAVLFSSGSFFVLFSIVPPYVVQFFLIFFLEESQDNLCGWALVPLARHAATQTINLVFSFATSSVHHYDNNDDVFQLLGQCKCFQLESQEVSILVQFNTYQNVSGKAKDTEIQHYRLQKYKLLIMIFFICT